MKVSKFLSLVLCMAMVMSLASPASAAVINPPFQFSLTNTKASFNEDLNNNRNRKTQPNDPATIYCARTDAPGWGYYMHLLSTDNSVQTFNYWYNNTNNLRHPTYMDQANSDQKDYRIRGRIDNDYNGTYYIFGEFNADYTNAPST